MPLNVPYSISAKQCVGRGWGISVEGLQLIAHHKREASSAKLKTTVEPRYNEVLGTMKITLFISGFSYQGEKTKI